MDKVSDMSEKTPVQKEIEEGIDSLQESIGIKKICGFFINRKEDGYCRITENIDVDEFKMMVCLIVETYARMKKTEREKLYILIETALEMDRKGEL